MKFDDVIAQLGDFGTYQKRIYLLLCIPAISCSAHTFLAVFLIGVPNHRCAIPGLDNDTYLVHDSHHQWLINQTIPINPDEDDRFTNPYDPCNMITANGSQASCDKWVYEQVDFTETFVTRENLVCSMAYTQSMMQMIYFGGLLVGSIGIGALSDGFGRKKALYFCFVLHIVAGFATAWSPGFAVFTFLRFVTGIATMGIFMTCFVLGMELVGPSKRVWAGIVIEFFFAFGMVVLVAVAYFVRAWNYLQIAMTAPSVLYLLYWWFIPESPRWLISKGRIAEAEVIIQKAAKVNNVSVPEKVFDEKTFEQDGPAGSVIDIFKSKVLILRSLVIFLNWFVITMVYYGLSLNSGNLGGNIFVNFLLTGLVEFPAYIACLLGLDRLGRRKIHLISMMIGGAACLSTIFTIMYARTSLEWLTITLAMIGKFGITGSFAIIYVFTAELYPTIVRHGGMGASSMCARIGGMIGPYVVDGGKLISGNFGVAFPMLVFGLLTVTAGLLSLTLPETLNKKLPETLADAENFGRPGYDNSADNSAPSGGKDVRYRPTTEKSSGGVNLDSYTNAGFDKF